MPATIFPACGGHCAYIKELQCPHAEIFNCANKKCCPGEKEPLCFSNLTSATWHGPSNDWRVKSGCMPHDAPNVSVPCDESKTSLAAYTEDELEKELARREALPTPTPYVVAIRGATEFSVAPRTIVSPPVSRLFGKRAAESRRAAGQFAWQAS